MRLKENGNVKKKNHTQLGVTAYTRQWTRGASHPARTPAQTQPQGHSLRLLLPIPLRHQLRLLLQIFPVLSLPQSHEQRRLPPLRILKLCRPPRQRCHLRCGMSLHPKYKTRSFLKFFLVPQPSNNTGRCTSAASRCVCVCVCVCVYVLYMYRYGIYIIHTYGWIS